MGTKLMKRCSLVIRTAKKKYKGDLRAEMSMQNMIFWEQFLTKVSVIEL